jgi:serine phosphatase RsbU (regulator of sigma subunit)
MFSSSHFPMCRARLDVGDKLLLFTDGLTEMANPAGCEYGLSRVKALAAAHADAEPQELLSTCLGQARTFAAETKVADDVTLLVLHRT